MKEGGSISIFVCDLGLSSEKKQLEILVKRKGTAHVAYLSRQDGVRPVSKVQ